MIAALHIACALIIILTLTVRIHDMPKRGVRATPHILLAVGALATGAEPYFTSMALTVAREFFLVSVTIFVVSKASFKHESDC